MLDINIENEVDIKEEILRRAQNDRKDISIQFYFSMKRKLLNVTEKKAKTQNVKHKKI